MLIKYFYHKNIYFFLLEIISIVASLGYIIVRSIIGSIPLFKSDDNVIKELQRRFRAHGMAISFYLHYW